MFELFYLHGNRDDWFVISLWDILYLLLTPLDGFKNHYRMSTTQFRFFKNKSVVVPDIFIIRIIIIKVDVSVSKYD